MKRIAFSLLSCFISQQPAQYCAVEMGSTPKDVVSATVAGKVQSVMCLPPSALTLNVGVVGFASWALVLATLDTKGKTVRKVNI